MVDRNEEKQPNDCLFSEFGDGSQSGLGFPPRAELEVLDPMWVVRLLRLGFILAVFTVLADIAQLFWLHPSQARVLLRYEVLELAASVAAATLSFLRRFPRLWRGVALGFCLIVACVATASDVALGEQVRSFLTIFVLLTATCALVPWEARWQVAVTTGLLASAAVSTALIQPSDPNIAALWVGAVATSAVTLASNRLWARWRLALAQTCDRLRTGEAQLRKMMDANPDQVSLVRMADRRFAYVNDELLKRGYKRDQMIGHTVDELGIWPNEAELEEFRRRLRADGFVRNQETGIRMPDGRIVPYLISAISLELRGEGYALSTARDISELKSIQNELVAAREAALAASRAKSEFLSSMSHEIRTPMNAILGMADLLAETTLTDEQRRFVEAMVNNGNALLDLINGILDLAKVESGRLNLEETDFDLAELVETVAETFSVRAHEKGLELLFRILPDVPTQLVGDPLRLRQILVNLIGNAIKFTEHGEVVLTVENDTDTDGLVALRFSVRDTGIGIASGQLDNIFQTFTQADSSTTRKFGGSGLGLAIARRLAELMNGRIWVESEAGKGSNFCFTACFRIGPSDRLSSQPLDLTGVRVLIVDDNSTNRLILRELLSRRGAQIHEAIGGREALIEVARARDLGEPYRLILLDCRMPGMDGFQVGEQLKREPAGSQPAVVMLTSGDMSHKIARVRELGIDAYVVKPVKRSDLFRAIASILGLEESFRRNATISTSARLDSVRDLRILLVEDSPDNRLLVEAYLKNLPYTLDVAENGAVAIEKFLRHRYDLVLMDMQMPVMDGLTATRRIRQWEEKKGRKPTPIVALTAAALEENVRQTLEAGCTAHINKPVKKTSLLAVIHEVTRACSAGRNRDEATEQSI